MASVLADVATLVKHPVYVLNVAATAVYTGLLLHARTAPLRVSLQSTKHCKQDHIQCSLLSHWPALQPALTRALTQWNL